MPSGARYQDGSAAGWGGDDEGLVGGVGRARGRVVRVGARAVEGVAAVAEGAAVAPCGFAESSVRRSMPGSRAVARSSGGRLAVGVDVDQHQAGGSGGDARGRRRVRWATRR